MKVPLFGEVEFDLDLLRHLLPLLNGDCNFERECFSLSFGEQDRDLDRS